MLPCTHWWDFVINSYPKKQLQPLNWRDTHPGASPRGFQSNVDSADTQNKAKLIASKQAQNDLSQEQSATDCLIILQLFIWRGSAPTPPQVWGWKTSTAGAAHSLALTQTIEASAMKGCRWNVAPIQPRAGHHLWSHHDNNFKHKRQLAIQGMH